MKKYFVDAILAGTSVSGMNCKFKNFKNKEYYQYKRVSCGETIAVLYLIYDYFLVQVSLPKILYGNNANIKPLSEYDIEKVFEIINKAIYSEINVRFDFNDFKIAKIEISNNYKCSSESDKQIYLDMFAKNYVSRRKKKEYDGSVVFSKKVGRITLYDKMKEIIDRPFRNKNVNKKECEKILRLEHKLDKRDVLRYCRSRTVHDFFESVDTEEILLNENQRTNLNLKILTEKDYYKFVSKQISEYRKDKQDRIINFLQELNIHGYEYINDNYSKYQVRNYLNLLKNEGVNPLYISGIRQENIVDFSYINNNKIMLSKEEIDSVVEKSKSTHNGFFTLLYKKLNNIKVQIANILKKCESHFINKYNMCEKKKN